jgi:CheY-like chemotaxis protein
VQTPGLVFVIDDEAAVRNVIVRMLRDSGFQVADASNGQDALALLQGGLTPAVILLDLWMPIMDGWEFLERARPQAPVIVISGISDQVQPLPACVVKLLRKPIGLEELTRAIRSVMPS